MKQSCTQILLTYTPPVKHTKAHNHTHTTPHHTAVKINSLLQSYKDYISTLYSPARGHTKSAASPVTPGNVTMTTPKSIAASGLVLKPCDHVDSHQTKVSALTARGCQ